MSFLGARPPGALPPGGLAVYGVPYDRTASFRRGSRFGPEAIRWASDSIETYSPLLDRDLDDVPFVDAGDLDVGGLDPEAMVGAIRRQLPPCMPLVLGGEHTITLGVVQALTPRYPDLAVIQWDAHTDLRDEYEGRRIAHATVMRRLVDGGVPLAQLGIRAGTRAEFEFARTRTLCCTRDVSVPAEVLARLEGRPLYLTVDIDVLDPSEAPGTGNPEPMGATYRGLLDALRGLASQKIVGMDLVEVAPNWDSTGRTAVLAASLVREMILLSAPSRVHNPTSSEPSSLPFG
ncbi:MAG TPA: agmatinase [bacterium]|nr:agmatinase [bacterium]